MRSPRQLLSFSELVAFQDRCPSSVDEGHQLVTVPISSIGVVSFGEPKIGERELVRRQRLHIDPEPAKERYRIRQMQTVSPGPGMRPGMRHKRLAVYNRE
jgi:hypothetical protein